MAYVYFSSFAWEFYEYSIVSRKRTFASGQVSAVFIRGAIRLYSRFVCGDRACVRLIQLQGMKPYIWRPSSRPSSLAASVRCGRLSASQRFANSDLSDLQFLSLLFFLLSSSTRYRAAQGQFRCISSFLESVMRPIHPMVCLSSWWCFRRIIIVIDAMKFPKRERRDDDTDSVCRASICSVDFQ